MISKDPNLNDARQLFQKLQNAQTNKNTHQEAIALHHLARYSLNTGDLEDGTRYLDQAIAIATTQNYPDILAECYNIQGGIQKQKGNWKLALDLWDKSHEIYLQANDIAGSICVAINMGNTNLSLGEIKYAEEIFDAALKMASQIQEVSLMVELANCLGVVYTRKRNFPIAHEYFQKAKFGYEQLKITTIGPYYRNLGDLYLEERNLPEAEACYKQAFALEVKTPNIAAQCLLLLALAPIYIHTKRFSEASTTLNKALLLVEGLHNPILKAHILFNVGINFVEQHQYQEAIPYCKEALNLFNKYGATADCNHVGKVLTQIASKLSNNKVDKS